MFAAIITTLTLSVCAVGADVPVLIQSPSIQRVTEGHTAWLWCTMSKARLEDTDLHWYQKLDKQQQDKLVFTHRKEGSSVRGWGFTERFQSYRDTSNSSYTLTVTDVVHSDSAVYYCRLWGSINGKGTQLIVTNRTDDPVLVQYPPVSKVPEGVTVQLHCALYNASVNVTDVHWYHQRPGNKIEWALSHFVNDSRCPEPHRTWPGSFWLSCWEFSLSLEAFSSSDAERLETHPTHPQQLITGAQGQIMKMLPLPGVSRVLEVTRLIQTTPTWLCNVPLSPSTVISKPTINHRLPAEPQWESSV
ncbi:uncharacterized protein [Hemitrygon akajei]|uniref:uncharacterized protein isoform X2 n=1 Tax=Hemitrygon akajei TaxID=2704970 RepID=UPI003BF9DEFB